MNRGCLGVTSTQWIEYQMHRSQLDLALLQGCSRHCRNGQGHDAIISAGARRFGIDEGQC
jgi:hypothetical protein